MGSCSIPNLDISITYTIYILYIYIYVKPTKAEVTIGQTPWKKHFCFCTASERFTARLAIAGGFQSQSAHP